MANYGAPDPWSTTFNIDAPQYNYWWSHKEFTDEPHVEVPIEFIPMLIDGYKDFVKRNIKYQGDKWLETGGPKRPKIKIVKGKARMYPGYHFTNEGVVEWLRKNGHADKAKVCQHNNVRFYDGVVNCTECSYYKRVT